MKEGVLPSNFQGVKHHLETYITENIIAKTHIRIVHYVKSSSWRHSNYRLNFGSRHWDVRTFNDKYVRKWSLFNELPLYNLRRIKASWSNHKTVSFRKLAYHALHWWNCKQQCAQGIGPLRIWTTGTNRKIVNQIALERRFTVLHLQATPGPDSNTVGKKLRWPLLLMQM